jgi:hypothetical protein
MADWWGTEITQAHGGAEQGVDLGTPFHTPLTAILPGTVQGVDCSSGWRCEVDILTQLEGQPYVEGYLHVDQPAVQPGDTLAAGDLVGLSGGQLSGGANPDAQPFSTGPHVEFDLWQGEQAWQNPIDPTTIVRGGPQVGAGGPSLPNLPGVLNPFGAGVTAGRQAAGSVINFDPWGGFQKAIGGTASSFGGWVSGRVVPFAETNLIALAVAAVVLLVLFGTGDGKQQSGGGTTVIPIPV